MNTPNRTPANGSQSAWLGFAMGIASMAALFIYGLTSHSQGMLVMSSSMAALLCAVWATTSAVTRKKSRN
ncbi:hypothetical protein [Paeniglutamicibacter antarcticus]|uniref:Uncharacterized protein n=1 Tax=Paeniglutamicibacter antarcticus TaxID=494023 RepID=A0ABP9TQ29_9MICC